ncbi:transcriptional antitermination N peptide [Morganella morganii]|uniref:transcriptional antitermination N peptide n=1 Tax=Morganella morganii TaxID=582 RepID=UPI001BDB835D|nr:hypothetical protein [Morganella morganii]MBT0442274.1 hypothetical protein [Morganella morganii subsp. morganii]
MSFRGYNCARSRRAERRKELQAEYAVNAGLKAAIHGEQEDKIKRPVLSLSNKCISRVDKAISVRSTPIYDSSDNRCLSTTAVYSTTRYQSKPKTEFGITARA